MVRFALPFLAVLAACAGSGRSVSGASGSSPVPLASNTSADFLSSEPASEIAEYIRLGQASLRDSEWFDAMEYFDSAMSQLADLEADESLIPGHRVSAGVYRDSVREWLVQSVTQAERLQADNLSELLDHEIEEIPFSEVRELDAELRDLPDRNFDLPLPSPLPPAVLQAVGVFTGPGRGYFTRWLQRRGRYDSLITAKLSERGMPRDLLYLAMVESGFSAKAWSQASASGLWQFISGTGRRYGLKDDWWEDPRRDPVRATDAALNYLEDLYAEFGDWHAAMAAYNCGEGRIRKQREPSPELTYWDMRLPAETRYYVPKILAAMIVGHNPEFFGFKVGETVEGPLRFDTVTVNHCLSLKGVSRVLEIPEDTLQAFNPALRRWCTPPGRKGFTLYLPEGSRERFYANYDRFDTLAAVPWRRHRVRPRESLVSIASRYGISAAAIQEANHLRKPRVRTGQSLLIPAYPREAGEGARAPDRLSVDASSHKVRPGETLYSIARRFQVSVHELREANGLGGSSVLQAGKVLRIPAVAAIGEAEQPQPAATAPARRKKVHVVARGETLSSIARGLGVSLEDLQGWNGLRGSKLMAGQRLVYHAGETGTVRGGPASGAEGERIALASADVPQYYQIKEGDSLWSISVRFGRRLDDLIRLNDNPKTLRPGQKIRLR